VEEVQARHGPYILFLLIVHDADHPLPVRLILIVFGRLSQDEFLCDFWSGSELTTGKGVTYCYYCY
jgi:hypothetical protein